eukprot:765713-Hanusia_phi.AAC.1
MARIYSEMKSQKKHMVSRLECSNNPRCYFNRLVVDDDLYAFLIKVYSGYLSEFSKTHGNDGEVMKDSPWLDFHKFFLCQSTLSESRQSLRSPTEIEVDEWDCELPDFYFDHVHGSDFVPGDVGIRWHVSDASAHSQSSIKQKRPIIVHELVHQGAAFASKQIEVGDIIESIDDHPVDSSDLLRVHNLFNGRNGTRLKIVLRKKKKNLSLKLLRQWQFCDMYQVVELRHSTSFPCMSCTKNPGPRILCGLSMNALWALYIESFQERNGYKQSETVQDYMSDIDDVRRGFVFLVKDLKSFLETGELSRSIRNMPQTLVAYIESNTGKVIRRRDALVPSKAALQTRRGTNEDDESSSSLNVSSYLSEFLDLNPFDEDEREKFKLGNPESPLYGFQALGESSETKESEYEDLFESPAGMKWRALMPQLQKQYDAIFSNYSSSAQKRIMKEKTMLDNYCLHELEELQRNWDEIVDDKLLDLRQKRKKDPFLTQFGPVKYPEVFWSEETDEAEREVLFFNKRFLNRTLKRREEQEKILKKMKFKYEREYRKLEDGSIHDAGPLHRRSRAAQVREAVNHLTMPLDDDKILREGIQEFARVKSSAKKPDLLTYIDDQFLGPADFGAENRSMLVESVKTLEKGSAERFPLPEKAENVRETGPESLLTFSSAEKRRRERLMNMVLQRSTRKGGESLAQAAEKKKSFENVALEYEVAKLDQLYWSETGRLLEDDLKSSEPELVYDNMTVSLALLLSNPLLTLLLIELDVSPS